jgi:hypothetical protein
MDVSVEWGGGSLWHLLRVLHHPNLYHSCCQDDRCLTLTKPVRVNTNCRTCCEPLIYIMYSVRLSVHEDVTPQGVNPPLQLLLPLNLTFVCCSSWWVPALKKCPYLIAGNVPSIAVQYWTVKLLRAVDQAQSGRPSSCPVETRPFSNCEGINKLL